ncbi:DUF6716 putative glycosyltransferase [Microbacterium xanthum]|uniref:DUF6716 putative glycosyltransferase n=1 Tax=Microbacterium xanthum TaxID=3079794 RepID=UPI002AD3E6C2|nr:MULTISPECIES: DUF6716 putative glycosyltransferase [unclassified Microbacterium]MDZ8172561.1 DUF6716 putative glycosyltransferase [Microbacterium sp. KSW-48]MDZ8202602.1 DUF6716 putative glycosyltransferase [Microbacterium sp. SSW1-59]
MTTTHPLRVIAIADTDSYVKWAAALLGSHPEAVDGRLLILETPLVVSAAQERAALSGSDVSDVARVGFDGLGERIRAHAPDVVLLAARGPLVRVLARVVARAVPTAVIATGLPGISVPATRKALVYRAQCDVFVLHSHREMRDFAALAIEKGVAQRFALARLPFARGGGLPGAAGEDLVFAAQAIVPRERPERLRVARMLVRAAEANPSRRVVVKLRATTGESQTHHEVDDYPGLLASLGELPPNLVFSTVPMSQALAGSAGLVTVSSTAAIEAVAHGTPVIALDTFGVAPDLINTVFEGSGLLAGEEAMVAGSFRHPVDGWLHDNYFHPAEEDTWVDTLAELVDARRSDALPHRPPWRRRGGALRDAWERKSVLGRLDRSASGRAAWAVGVPARHAVRFVQRIARVRAGASS